MAVPLKSSASTRVAPGSAGADGIGAAWVVAAGCRALGLAAAAVRPARPSGACGQTRTAPSTTMPATPAITAPRHMTATLAAMESPVDAADLAEVLRPFGSSRMLPATAYTSPAVLAWERRHLFAGAWTCVGRRDEVLADGATQRAVAVGDVGVLLTLAGGRLSGFANVCRHRGHELLPDGGTANRGAVICPYHGWSYHLDGALAAAPRMPAGFAASDHGLV